MVRRICVFCASSSGAPVFGEAARALGRELARRRIGLVYGGGNVGLMGLLADAALEAGAEVLGVIPRPLVDRELAHRGLTELHVVATMHERKSKMHELADGFIALPGGFGTLDELFEALTWGQLGMHGKPCALLDVDGYYQPLLALLDGAVESGLLRAEHRGMLLYGTEAGEVIGKMERYVAPGVTKWIVEGEE